MWRYGGHFFAVSFVDAEKGSVWAYPTNVFEPKGPRKIFRVWTPTFCRYNGHRKELCLGAMPKELSKLVSIRAKDWQRYQDDLERIPAWEQAERFVRLKEAHRLKSNCALERMLGLPYGRVSRALRALEPPAPVLDYLKAFPTPALVRTFHEKALYELAKLGDAALICREFRRQLRMLPETQR